MTQNLIKVASVGQGFGTNPTGGAGGALTGSYPNPTLASGAVTSGTIASGAVLQNFFGDLNGLVTSYSSGSAAGTSGSVNISRGRCADVSGTLMMQIASGLTKTIASGIIWASGTAKAGFDAVYPLTSLQSGWLHVHAISDGTVTDVIICNNVSGVNPVLPSGMIYNRRIASLKTDASGNVVPYKQVGDTFLYVQGAIDYAARTLLSGAQTLAVSVPNGITTTTLMQLGFSNTGLGAVLFATSLNQDIPITANSAPTSLNQVATQYGTAGVVQVVAVSGALRFTTNNASGNMFVTMMGWVDTRGKDG